MENNASTVSRCDASACRFNDNHNCTAGQIEISMSADMAQCLTFSPKDGAQGERPAAQG